MAGRRHIEFYLNDEKVELGGFRPDLTLIEYIREDIKLRGTKEGCAAGDCGACTVLVGELDDNDSLNYRPINSCITFVARLHGVHVITIEYLSQFGMRLNELQKSMVDFQGSQCGFCTPGIVMALYSHWISGEPMDRETFNLSMQGNLCRCTGYEAIFRALHSVRGDGSDEPLIERSMETRNNLRALRHGEDIAIESPDGTAFIPADVDRLGDLVALHPEATIVAGGTDVGLWATKLTRNLKTVIFSYRAQQLEYVSVGQKVLSLGPNVTYAKARDIFLEHFPELSDLMKRIGGPQIRNAGTVGGNIGNGSPIGDMLPVLISLNATFSLRHKDERRIVRAEDYFISYGKQDRRPGEFIEMIDIPKLERNEILRIYKVTKRFDEDISTVLGSFKFKLTNEKVIESANVSFGGMAEIPKRAGNVEKALVGRTLSKDSVALAANQLVKDFKPISDARSSADYRLEVARNLLFKFWLEGQSDRKQSVRSS